MEENLVLAIDHSSILLHLGLEQGFVVQSRLTILCSESPEVKVYS